MFNQTRNKILLLVMTCALAAVSGGGAFAQSKVLPVPLFGQETGMWCWASTTQMSTTYVGNTRVRQCVEANTRFGHTDCCSNPAVCTNGGWPEYWKWGFNSRTTAPWGTPLTFDQIMAEIDANRPVNFSWGWTGGGGHIMVANGYFNLNAPLLGLPPTQYVWVNNPWPPGVGAQSWIPYSTYVQASDHVHWQDYYAITRLNGTHWRPLPGQAYDVAAGIGGSMWVIGINALGGGFGIYQWNGSNNWSGFPGAAVRIAVDPKGDPWVVNDTGTIFHGSVATSSWVQLPGAAKDIGVGADGTVWVIGTNAKAGGFGIWVWNGSGWASVSGAAVRVAVDPKGDPWVVNDGGGIYHGSFHNSDGSFNAGGSWTQLPGAAMDIGAGGDGSVWVIGTNPVPGGFGIYRWNGSNWDMMPGGATNISVGSDGNPLVVNSTGQIFLWE